MDDFRKYATKHLGMNSLVLDDVIKSQAGYLNPYILEERQLNVTQLDVFSRLMMDRIIFLGTQVDDYTANTLQAQLLYLDSVDPGKDISIYINIYIITYKRGITKFSYLFFNLFISCPLLNRRFYLYFITNYIIHIISKCNI